MKSVQYRGTKRTYTYERVSTWKQTVDNQTPLLDKWALEHADEKPIRLSETVSGRKMTGAKLQEMWSAVKEGKVRRIVVPKVDRLGRNLLQALSFVADMAANDVDLVVLNNPAIQINTPMGKLNFQFLMAFAEFEAETIKDRTKVGMQRVMRTCKKCNFYDPDAPKGKDFVCKKCGCNEPSFKGGQGNKVWLTETSKAKIDEVMTLRKAGINKTRISQMLKINVRTISRIIAQEEGGNLPPR